MTQGYSGTAQISGYFNSILEDAVFVARESMIMPSLVTRYSGTGWEDRKVSVYPEISASTVAETDDYANPTQFGKSSLATFTPFEKMAQVILTDRRLTTDPQNARQDAVTELGAAMADAIEQSLLDEFTNFTDSHGAGANSTFTFTSMANSVASLRNAKSRGPFSFVLHPYHWLDVWVELGKPAATVIPGEVATEALREYFVDRLLGCNIYQHALIDVDGSDDAISAVF